MAYKIYTFNRIPETSKDGYPPLMDDRRKRLLFHCTHMGMKENDVMFGEFARAYVAGLSARDMADLEALLENNDQDLFNWALGRAEVPAVWDTPVLRRLQDFNKDRKA